ncbi:hypothetical protein SprV_0702362000 [Sparganum proliferum]
MMARLTDNGAIFEAFAMANGVKREFMLAPTLFSLMSSAMLLDVHRDERPWVRMAYRNNGQLFNGGRMKAITRLSTTTVYDLLSTDDCALSTTTEVDMQQSADLFATEWDTFGLKINTEKHWSCTNHQRILRTNLLVPMFNDPEER